MPFEHDIGDSTPKRKTIDPHYMSRLLRYDPEEGALYWKPRPMEMFALPRTGKGWNTRFAGARADNVSNSNGYRTVCVFDEVYLAHRVAWAIHYGEAPPDYLDHHNGNRGDMRIINLVAVTAAENSKNRGLRATNQSGISGIWLQSPKAWGARWMFVQSGNGGIAACKAFHCVGQAIRHRNAVLRDSGFNPLHGIRRGYSAAEVAS